MKKLIYFFAFISLNCLAQNKYLTKIGQVNFEASVPSFEEIKANNNTVTAILNSENGEFATLVLVKGFRFKNALMEEHFNENYAESDTYPKATFKGKIVSFSFNELSETPKVFKINGTLTFHGKTNQLENMPLEISKSGEGNIIVSGTFTANPADYDIKIPKVVRNKIAESIEVLFNFQLKKK
ncbi:YceI family protein [Flavivirga abyssicola]|uniref:YceI family protein n=1 Tax=Flavivirga abyssicola TaxID=3063533 RepID=UPI0026DEE414|nr:YceI family protein [Flavivirga sp. MEBiC07777]WVK12199.1 YceI family protein [Flavivirga sp. MEBiC07777]